MHLLSGVRILAVEQYGAGPYGTMILADLGAEVIKIENPLEGGDVARYVPPFAQDGDSLFFQSFNRNKRSVLLNLNDNRDRRVFNHLVANSHVVFNNLRGDLPERLGLTYQALAPINPSIVCCSLSGFGRTGPRYDEPGYDMLIQALTGIMSMTGEPDGPPTKGGISFVDFAGGLVAAVGILAGLHRARETGQGCDIDTSLFDIGLSMLNYIAAWTLNRSWQPHRLPASAHPSLVPTQLFATKDGYIYIFCQKEKFWQNFCRLINREDLLDDHRFRSAAERLQNKQALIPELVTELKRKTTREWVSIFRGHVPCAPVNTVDEALRDAQTVARGMIITVDHPKFGPIKLIGNPLHVDGMEDFPHRPAPTLGADTDDILRELGFHDDTIGKP